jgi:hypothetical protein
LWEKWPYSPQLKHAPELGWRPPRRESRFEVSALVRQSSNDCCFSAIPATIVSNCDNWEFLSDTCAVVVLVTGSSVRRAQLSKDA